MTNVLRWMTYETCAWSSYFTLLLGWSLRSAGRENIPKSGPVLFISNHESFLDPPAVGVGCSRHMSYLARKPLFKNPFFGFLIRSLNAVPVDQEGMAKEGIRGILEKLNEGWPVLVFPEGARSEKGGMMKLQPGVSLLIKRVHCPIVPVGIAGAFQAWNRWEKLPKPAPLFMPPSDRCLGVAYGPPRHGESIANLPRDEMLQLLAADIAAQVKIADAIRRKPAHESNGCNGTLR